MIPVSVTEQIFSLLTPEDWRSLYDADAIVKTCGRDQQHLFASAALHIREHLKRELDDVSQQVQRLCGQHMRNPDMSFAGSVECFFNASNPLEASKAYLDSPARNGNRMWTKPLHDDVWLALSDILEGARPERFSRKKSNKLLYILSEQKSRLIHCMQQWQPNVSDVYYVRASTKKKSRFLA